MCTGIVSGLPTIRPLEIKCPDGILGATVRESRLGAWGCGRVDEGHRSLRGSRRTSNFPQRCRCKFGQ